MSVWAAWQPRGILPTSMRVAPGRVWYAASERCEVVVEHDVGFPECAEPADGEQVGVAGSAADENDLARGGGVGVHAGPFAVRGRRWPVSRFVRRCRTGR